jgi:hypothetical protein
MKKNVVLLLAPLLALILLLGAVSVNSQSGIKRLVFDRSNTLLNKSNSILLADGDPPPWPPPEQSVLLADGDPPPWPPPEQSVLLADGDPPPWPPPEQSNTVC